MINPSQQTHVRLLSETETGEGTQPKLTNSRNAIVETDTDHFRQANIHAGCVQFVNASQHRIAETETK